MIDRYLIRYFLAVIDHGNFSRAASACNVSQPTLSIGIAKLEAALGIPLFIRSNQRVELTTGGSRFQVHARRIEREFNLAMQAMTDESPATALRIGLLTSISGERIAQALQAFEMRDQRERLELVQGTERELAGHLAKGRIDVALTLVGRGGDRFKEEMLLQEGYSLAMSHDHRLAGQDRIGPDEIASDVMIVRRHCEALSETSRFFTEHGVRPHFAFRSTNDERVLLMVAAGLGITVMPDSYRAVGVVRPKLSGFRLERTLGFAFAHHAETLAGDRPPVIAALATAFAKPPRGR
jgi:DNA-binding transcriptional LysR family regulator